MRAGAAASVTALLFGLVLLHCSTAADAAVYNVGDSKGWDLGVAGWEKGKNFKAGDTMVFKYNLVHNHNVVKVDKASFDSCKVPTNAPKFASGNDKIVLDKGPNYFICGVPGHCQAGMKINAIAA